MKKIPAQYALNKYCESIKARLRNDGTNHVIFMSIDSQHNQGKNAYFINASEKSSKVTITYLKESAELVFFVGGVYECTMNYQRGCFSQSQLAYMLYLPSEEIVQIFGSIAKWIVPTATQHLEFEQPPSREYYIK